MAVKKKGKCGLDLEKIWQRVEQKKSAYRKYDFTPLQNDMLKTFFDLSQEYDSLESFYRICVTVPCDFMNVEVRLYLFDQPEGSLQLLCDSNRGLLEEAEEAPAYISLQKKEYEKKTSFIAPICSKKSTISDAGVYEKTIRGMLEIIPPSPLSDQEKFFLKKFASRIGYNLHNRIIHRQYRSHLKFVQNLVVDIEHNVIVPNMYFRHLFNKLRKRIRILSELEETLRLIRQESGQNETLFEMMFHKLTSLHQALIDIHQEMLKHHKNSSLFLESLFRRDHFEKGHLVLRPKKCLVDKEIIAPQLAHYANRLASRGITIERPADMLEEEIPLTVDVGLLSQVYANLFSNAVRYTSDITTYRGTHRKFVAYGREVIKNYFSSRQHGIKFNVFSSGPHLSEEEAEAVFSEGYRGENIADQPGTGHGLSFVKQVVEIHGGHVGYEPTPSGNNFFFILPLPE
jgi:signal transduction histidine kinase